MAEISKATFAHCQQMAPLLRVEDVEELRAATGDTPIGALTKSLEISVAAFTLCIDGEPVAMYGVAPQETNPDVGVVWLLGTEKLRKYPKLFWKTALQELPKLGTYFPVLINAVDSKYEKALRFARRLGFQIRASAPYGVDGEPFNLIARRS